MDDRKLEKIMRHRVKEIKGFYTHLVVYIVVNLVLVGIWFLIGGRFPWFIFALAGCSWRSSPSRASRVNTPTAASSGAHHTRTD